MKILSRAAFMRLPAGTIFCKGKPWYWESLSVKGDTTPNDFGYASMDDIEARSGEQAIDRLGEMLETGKTYPLGIVYGRDGCFDDDDLFLVYEAGDLAQVIAVLQAALPPTNSGV